MKPVRTFGLPRQAPDRSIRYAIEQNAKATSNISFGTTSSNTDGDINIQCWKAAGTSPAGANTEFAVTHNLSHIPFGFIIVSRDKAANFYKSTTAWSKATSTSLGSIYLKCDTATVAFTVIIL